MLGLGDAIVEALLEGGIDGGAGAGGEAVVVGEELDVEDAEAVKFCEDVGRGVGGGTEGVFGVSGHPLLEVVVGAGEVEVIEGVVALVEGSSCQRCAGEQRGHQEKQKTHREESPGGGGPGIARSVVQRVELASFSFTSLR